MKTAIIDGKIIHHGSVLRGYVLLIDKTILKIIHKKDFHDRVPFHIVDAKGYYVSPGLIDIHIHGLHGHDTMDANHSAIKTLAELAPQHGVTTLLPTTMTADQAHLHRVIDNVADYQKHPLITGAHILGVHMEGPFINPQYSGAQGKDHICPPDINFIKRHRDIIKMITFAPEMDKEQHFIDTIKKEFDIVLSIGHSAATYEQAVNAFRRGVTHVTHCFNAMPALHHRKPGLIGATLSHAFTCDFICDDFHINPALYQGIVHAKEKKHIVLISDSIRATGLGDGFYDLGGHNAEVKNGISKFPDGTIAGSTLKLNQAVANMYKATNITLPEAIEFASLNPARTLRIDHYTGSFEQGNNADIIFHDTDMNIYATWIDGKLFYQAQSNI